MKNSADSQRIQFLIERDGLHPTIAFSKRTLLQYRKEAKERTMLRKSLVLCCLSHREFLITNKEYFGGKK